VVKVCCAVCVAVCAVRAWRQQRWREVWRVRVVCGGQGVSNQGGVCGVCVQWCVQVCGQVCVW